MAGDIERDPKHPEKSWQTQVEEDGDGGDVSPNRDEYPEDPPEQENSFWRTASKQHRADKRHSMRIAEGIPHWWRFNPVQFVKITGAHTSRLSAYVHILIPFIPAGIIMYILKAKTDHLTVFVLNFIAMIPAGNLLAFGAGELEHHMPKTIGAAFEIFTGAIVEIVICVLLFRGDEFPVILAALLGSMFANLLLVTGICFLAGGIAYREQRIASYVADLSNAALLVSAVGTVAPSLFFQTINTRVDVNRERTETKVLGVSRVVSIGLLLSYFCFLFFELHTHSVGFNHVLERAESVYVGKKQYRNKLSAVEASILATIGLALVIIHAHLLIIMIPEVISDTKITELFLGLILVPLVEKFGEHLTAINQAWDNQIDLAMYHCLGATIQTALFVTPVVVLVGWALDKDMSLNFEFFIALSLLLAILIVGNFVRDGKTNWLKGMFLIMVYFVLAVTAWHDPDQHEDRWPWGLSTMKEEEK
ncbi:hypothetical protein ABW20_dc0105848 [Dactylellina cionopaga]|nr:hypothetical protein ABW20_dc0105848 [Dactylellina cionopaga]